MEDYSNINCYSYRQNNIEITKDKIMNNIQNKNKNMIGLKKINYKGKKSINNKHRNSKKEFKQINNIKNKSNKKNISIRESYNYDKKVINKNLKNINLNNLNNFLTCNKNKNTNQIISNTNDNSENNGKKYKNNYYIEEKKDFNYKIYNNKSYFFNKIDKDKIITNNNKNNSERKINKFNNNFKEKMDNPNNKNHLNQSTYLVDSINNINFNNNKISIGNINIIISKEDKNEIQKFLTRFNRNNDYIKNNSVNIKQDIERKMSPQNFTNIQLTNSRKKNIYNSKFIRKENNINQKKKIKKYYLRKKLYLKLDKNKINLSTF